MQTEKKLADKKPELLKLILGWAKREKILQSDEILKVDVRVVKNPRLIVLNIGDQQKASDIKMMPVWKLKGLSTRTFGVIRGCQIETVGELAALSYGEILKKRNCGKVTILELVTALHELGIEVDWLEKGKKFKWKKYSHF